MAIKQLKEDSGGTGLGQATISPRTVMLQIPSSLLSDSNPIATIFESLRLLSQIQLLRFFDQTGDENTRFSITLEGMTIFRKHLLPTKIVKDKKSYNGIIDKIEGNSEIKHQLKKLGDHLRDKLEDESTDHFIKFAMNTGSDVLIYYVHLTHSN